MHLKQARSRFLLKIVMGMGGVFHHVLLFDSLQETDDFVLILHSGIIGRDINLFKKHFYSYISVIPGVTVHHMVLAEVENQAFKKKTTSTVVLTSCFVVVLCFFITYCLQSTFPSQVVNLITVGIHLLEHIYTWNSIQFMCLS